MADLIMVTGPPGAGKSTVARELVTRFPASALVVGDEFFSFVKQSHVPPWLPEADRQNEIVTGASAAAAGRLAMGGYTVVYDGAVGPWSLPLFLATTGLDHIHYAMLMPSEDRCISRVKDRVGHGFTDIAATRHMYRDYQKAPVESRHLLADPPDDPEHTARLIHELLDAGNLVFR